MAEPINIIRRKLGCGVGSGGKRGVIEPRILSEWKLGHAEQRVCAFGNQAPHGVRRELGLPILVKPLFKGSTLISVSTAEDPAQIGLRRRRDPLATSFIRVVRPSR